MPKQNIIKGSTFAIIAFFCMAVFGILTNEAYKSGNALWVSFITYAVGTLCVLIFILPQGVTGLKSKHYSYLIARAVIGTAASFLYMLSMHYIPIINATLLFNTAPIFIPLLGVFYFKKKIQREIWYAVLLGFLGIVFIIKPTSDILTHPGNFIGLAAGIALAIAYLIMKLLTATDTGMRIIFYYFSIGTLIQLPFLTFARDIPLWNSCLYAIVSGIMLFITQVMLVKAYLYAEASQVGVYQYSSIVFVGLIEWLIWQQVPGIMDIIGFVLVTIAGIIIIRSGQA